MSLLCLCQRPPPLQKLKNKTNKRYVLPLLKLKFMKVLWISIISYECSFSDGEVDDPQEFMSDEDVPSEPAQECIRLTWLNTTGTLGRAALKVKSQKMLSCCAIFKNCSELILLV